MKLALTALLSGTLIGCATTAEDVSPIDQIPMYGGMDRASVPELRAGDQWFIEGAAKEFGSREKASKYFSDYGARMHQGGNNALGMKRCNQAWLLDPNNFDAYWCFGAIMQDKGVTADALKHLETAHKLNPDHAEVSVDLARTYSIFGASPNRSDSERQEYFTKARVLFEEASAKDSKNAYVYEVWAAALYWQGDYAGSWSMVERVRQLGGVPSEGFLKKLASKMPAPTSR